MTPRVLMQIRPDWEAKPGGDGVQLRGTRAALEQLGVNISLTTELQPDLAGFDIVHTFNTTRPQEPLEHCANAMRQGKPVVLSTIYWDAREYITRARRSIEAEFTPPAADLAALDCVEAQAALVAEMADLLLPNASGEIELLVRNLGADPAKCAVVPNAVDPSFFSAAPDEFVREHGLQDFVLCVGRLELRKNQHSLLAALRDTDLPVVLIGPALDPQYRDLCRSYATGRVTFIPQVPHERLPAAYAAARVHVLPSWYDTPGLVSLEAAAAGCNVVSTDRGPTREYLGDMAWYCSPDDIDSIRRATLAAWQAPRSDRLREHVRSKYTWEIAGQRTLDAYRAALAERARREAAGECARADHLMAGWLRYARAAKRTMDAMHAEAAKYAKATEEYNRSLLQSCRDQEAQVRRLAAEIEAITSRRLYRWGERLAHTLRWRRRRG